MPTEDDTGRPSALARARRVAAARPSPQPPQPPAARQRGPEPGVTFHATPEVAEAARKAATPSRAGRNLPAAIGVGVGLGALIVASLFVWRPSFAMIVGVAVLYGCYEMSRALRAASIRVS